MGETSESSFPVERITSTHGPRVGKSMGSCEHWKQLCFKEALSVWETQWGEEGGVRLGRWAGSTQRAI